jgi:hypothetical protein
MEEGLSTQIEHAWALLNDSRPRAQVGEYIAKIVEELRRTVCDRPPSLRSSGPGTDHSKE